MSNIPTFHTRFTPPFSGGVKFVKPTLCQAHFRESCDINNLVKRGLTGDVSVFRNPRYVDLLAAPDSFADASNRAAFARTVWEDLPQHVKHAYGSPEALLAEFDREVKASAEKRSKPSVVKSDESSEVVSADAPKTV